MFYYLELNSQKVFRGGSISITDPFPHSLTHAILRPVCCLSRHTWTLLRIKCILYTHLKAVLIVIWKPCKTTSFLAIKSTEWRLLLYYCKNTSCAAVKWSLKWNIHVVQMYGIKIYVSCCKINAKNDKNVGLTFYLLLSNDVDGGLYKRYMHTNSRD